MGQFDKYFSTPTNTVTPTKTGSNYDKYFGGTGTQITNPLSYKPVQGVEQNLITNLASRGVSPTDISNLAPEQGSQDVMKNTLSNFWDSLKSIPVGLYNMITKPTENIQQAEKLLGFTKPKPTTTLGKVEQVITQPIRTLGQGFSRLVGPAVEPLATDIGEIIATNELSKQVANGTMPSSVLNDISVLKKTTPQIVGDVTQAVLAAYSPELIGDNIGKGILPGALKGLAGGTAFGTAQALSSGETKPLEIAKIIATNALGGLTIGGVTGGIGAKTTDLINKIDEIKNQVESPQFKTVLDNVQKEVVAQSENIKPQESLQLFTKDELSKLPLNDRNDYEKFIQPKIDNLPIPKDNESLIVFTGDGKKGQYVDTYPEKALNRGVNQNTKVLVVDKSMLETTGFKNKDLNGERKLKNDIGFQENNIPQTKITKVANDINNKMVEKGFEQLPQDQQATYNPITKKETIGKVSDFMSKNIEEAKKAAITGEVPNDVHKQVLFNAIVEHATKNNDYQLLKDLANSPIATERSLAAQTLGASGFNQLNDSPVEKIQEIYKTRERNIKPVERNKINDELSQAVKKVKVTKETWASFIESIKC